MDRAQAARNSNRLDNLGRMRIQKESTESVTDTMAIPVGRLAIESRRAALSAQAQLARDAADLERMNADIARVNQATVAILADISGQSFGEDRQAWENWLKTSQGFRYNYETQVERPTVVENVPLNYQFQTPTFVAQRSFQQVTTNVGVTATMGHSCFAAGTPVWTSRGLKPIDTLEVGDQVLALDRIKGGLRYQPIIQVHHNAPDKTLRIKFGDETVVSTGLHRFWKAGHGWVMARDLKVGDRLRTVDGIKPVGEISADRVQPVFNLDVAVDASFFVGREGALVHDDSLPDFRERPFDAPARP